MKPIENGLVLVGTRELHHAQVGVAILKVVPTERYLCEVEEKVVSELHAQALVSVSDEDIRLTACAALALGERSPREEDLISDIASGIVIKNRKTAEFPVLGYHADVVKSGLVALERSCALGLFFRGVNKKLVERMLDDVTDEVASN